MNASTLLSKKKKKENQGMLISALGMKLKSGDRDKISHGDEPSRAKKISLFIFCMSTWKTWRRDGRMRKPREATYDENEATAFLHQFGSSNCSR